MKNGYVKLLQRLFLCIYTGLFHVGMSAQGSFHVGYQITEEQGLPGRYITAMAEDIFGFTWMGGVEGLVRYDGIAFKSFKRQEGNDRSLIDNRIRCLLADGDKLWIGTHNGVSVLDLLKEQFTNYQFDSKGKRDAPDQTLNQQINTLHKDQQGNIWIGSAVWGPIKYSSSTGDFQLASVKEEDIPDYVIQPNRLEVVLDFCNDIHNPDILWIGLYAGLLKWNIQTNQYRLFTFPFSNKEEQINRNAFRTIYQHTDGKIYTGAWYNVMQVFDPVTGQLTSLPGELVERQNMQAMSVREISPATDSTLWITSNMGILTYHPGQNTFLHIWKNDEKKGNIYAIDFIDSNKRIYSFQDNGLTYYDPEMQHFIPVSFAHLNPTGAGLGFNAIYDKKRKRYMVCAGNVTSLYHFDPMYMEWHITPLPKEDLLPDITYTLRNIYPLNEDLFVLAATHSIYLYDALEDKIKYAPVALPMEVPRIHNVYVDSKKNVWIATVHDGVLHWNTITNAIKRYSLTYDTEFGAGNEDTFLEDRTGRIWIKSRNAFAVYDPALDSLTYYRPDDLVTPFYTTFAEDSHGNMWLASITGWIGKIDLSLPELISEWYDLGKHDEGIVTFQIDEADQIWCAFQNRLVRIDLAHKKTTIFPFSPALRSGGFFYMKYMPDGNLVFTSKDQIILVNTEKLREDHRPLIPYLTDIDIREQPLKTDTVVHSIKRMHLKPNENFFSISFSALGLLPGESYTFRYRLIGFQDDWITVTDRTFANFTNVPSGDYLFELQVAGGTGEFSDDSYKLPISIEKRFFEKGWVRLLGILLLVGFIHSIYRYRIHQIKKEEGLKTEFQQQLAMAETNALRAQMNPHFIFNSLNSIENYILKNNPDKAASYLNDFARLIRLILQNSRSKQISLKTELETLELYLEMEQLRFSEKFKYDIEVDDTVHAEQIEIPPLLIQPFVENAIWHGLMPKAGNGHVLIKITQKESTLFISVEDNGIGREKSAQIQARKKQGEKESIGISITKDRIELLNKIHETEASVIVTDLKDHEGNASGTRVDISIPV